MHHWQNYHNHCVGVYQQKWTITVCMSVCTSIDVLAWHSRVWFTRLWHASTGAGNHQWRLWRELSDCTSNPSPTEGYITFICSCLRSVTFWCDHVKFAVICCDHLLDIPFNHQWQSFRCSCWLKFCCIIKVLDLKIFVSTINVRWFEAIISWSISVIVNVLLFFFAILEILIQSYDFEMNRFQFCSHKAYTVGSIVL